MALLVSKFERHSKEHMIEVFQDDDEDPHLFDLRELRERGTPFVKN